MMWVVYSCMVGIMFCVYMLFHNERVYRTRRKIIDDQRIDLLLRVSYDEMFHAFWRNPKSFFPEVFTK